MSPVCLNWRDKYKQFFWKLYHCEPIFLFNCKKKHNPPKRDCSILFLFDADNIDKMKKSSIRVGRTKRNDYCCTRMTRQELDSSASGYISDSFEGISQTFTDVEILSTSEVNVVAKAKRYGGWRLLKGLRKGVAATLPASAPHCALITPRRRMRWNCTPL